jgi:acetyl esterase/lipase
MKIPVLLALLLVALLPATSADTSERKLTSAQRLEREHLKATHEARLRFARERQDLPNYSVYEDFRAVIHVHAEDSDHTKGTRQEVLEAAKKSAVRIVMLTDHRGPKPNTWHGLRDGVLFFAGSEESGDGELRFPQFDSDRKPLSEGALRFLSHPEERPDASTDGMIGMEICNRHTDAKVDKAPYTYLLAASLSADSWKKVLENLKAYPDELFAAGCDYRSEIMARWDAEIQKRPFTAIGANDAHQNQIFKETTFDPYEVSFRNLCTHILALELTEPAVRAALRAGHAYVSHDWFCDPTGFAFGAVNTLGVFPMGDSAPMAGTTRLVGVTPLAARLKLIHNGKVLTNALGTNLTFVAKDPGAYRLEAWLDIDGEERPWIYSNPVYLKEFSLASVRLPSSEVPANVDVKKDILYVEGQPEDEAKHKLDLYLPKDKEIAPVFLFVHGGAWFSGDRNLYGPLGNRFAREGIVTVVPSYRLAPANPHPAQIEDAAAAFAWVVRHIREYGGDTNRIYLGGHSAGGHLAALLTLNEHYLKAHKLSAKNIRGTIALSGVFDLTRTEGQGRVFGHDPQVRREASPLFFAKEAAPPFLVTYCQWDYPTLPAQARQFHAALREAGTESELIFIPRENHISEMISVTTAEDPTARAILKFIR